MHILRLIHFKITNYYNSKTTSPGKQDWIVQNSCKKEDDGDE